MRCLTGWRRGLGRKVWATIAPKVKDFQPAKEWRGGESIPVEPKCGWLIYLAE
jgi:hypothetical protein